MREVKTIGVIGSGVSGLTAAATLAQKGHKVLVFEKNEEIGGRLRKFTAEGFTFDMGPSWYWMPDVFEKFYSRFGYTSSDFYELKKLDPGFQIIYRNSETIKVPQKWDELLDLFESLESGAADNLKKFMTEAEYKYQVGVSDLMYKPGLSLNELITSATLKGLFRLQIFSSFSNHVRRYFKDERIISLMEFPILFLGAMPKDTPALYSLMNYAGLKQGTFYPMGGFHKVIDAMVRIAKENDVRFHTSESVTAIRAKENSTIALETEKNRFRLNGLIASADYHHVESALLEEQDRNYSQDYWNGRVMAPSALLFYVGINTKLKKLEHHNLFFDEDFDEHSKEIYSDPKWPGKPLFYVCCPSKTDPSVAPEGKENLFILMPIATGLSDTEAVRKSYFHKLIKRLELFTGAEISDNIAYIKSYCINDFVADYNSFKGNAYGLANTLMQTANLKPKIKNRQIPNFYYAGQLTVPGPGVPPSIVSGQIAAEQLLKSMA